MDRLLKVQRRKKYSDSLRQRQFHTSPPRLVLHTRINFYDSDSYETMAEYPRVTTGLIQKKIITNTNISICVGNYDICIICQFKPNFGDILRTLHCKHLFHINCIDTWLTEHNICPICKQNI